MPFEDGSFDAVTNVYLFHEMPKEARRNAAREFARVLKPGGKLFFVDSAQVGDGAALGMEKAFDQALERFPMFNHEPYYRDYSLTDLKALFGEFGLVYEDSNVAWVSKCWCFTKREAEEVKAESATLEATAQTEPEVETKAEEASESAAARWRTRPRRLPIRRRRRRGRKRGGEIRRGIGRGLGVMDDDVASSSPPPACIIRSLSAP